MVVLYRKLPQSENAVLVVTRTQTGETEAAFDGGGVARFELGIGQGFEGLNQAVVFGRGVGDDLLEALADGGEAELVELLVQRDHESGFQGYRIKASYSERERGSVANSFRWGRFKRKGG